MSNFPEQFNAEKMYLNRHFRGSFLMKLFYRLCRKNIEKLMFDCADIGYGIRMNDELKESH